MKQENKALPVLAGITFSTIFGFSFMVTKEGLDFLQPIQLLGLRFGVAAFAMTLLYSVGIIKINLKGKNLKLLLSLALFQPIAYFIFEVLGINYTQSSSEAGMMIALIPIFVAVLASIFLKERPTGKQFFFIITSVAGVMFINIIRSKAQLSANFIGILFLFGAVISAGVFNILSKKSSFHFKPVEITFVMMWAGAIIFNLIGVTQHVSQGALHEYLQPLTEPSALVAVLYLGLLSSIVAFFMVNFTLSKIEASQSAVFANLTTVVSIIAGVVILKESFYWFHLVGGLMIIIGVWGTNYYGKKAKKIKPSNG